eukprot:CAMPEP_0202893076 /NCGR_PEP_ID=MMETSP1392-20130828/2715_1 /ASSEMBLY_ACC=CAM_ASM_000868 /TAXON_ID=225041 /ORGANISM="Chlamydomonas chlamydogama, Strain SAG 11-48b" /LENGTH=145 /DNA_ID=CAMNT_0049577269 /DNA_START=983 /DNA_END=1420 /DNA_ORIENTATION=+
MPLHGPVCLPLEQPLAPGEVSACKVELVIQDVRYHLLGHNALCPDHRLRGTSCPHKQQGGQSRDAQACSEAATALAVHSKDLDRLGFSYEVQSLQLFGNEFARPTVVRSKVNDYWDPVLCRLTHFFLNIDVRLRDCHGDGGTAFA